MVNEKECIKAIDLLYENKLIDNSEYNSIKDKIKKIQNTKYINELKELNKKEENSNKKIVLKVSNLTKHYKNRPKPAIDNISFKLKEGEFHVFVGANGAGKTTTIKAIVGAYAKWSGEIKIDDLKNTTSLAKKKMGYIPENAFFPKNMDTKTYLVTMAMMSGIEKKKAIKFADEKLAALNMTNLAHQNPNDFSSGQKKKILLAQALVNNPKLLIMDEPAANLDPIARNEFFGILKQLQKEGKSIFLSSHILAEVGKYADSVTILDGGKIVYTGKIDPRLELEDLYFSYVKEGSVDTGIK